MLRVGVGRGRRGKGGGGAPTVPAPLLLTWVSDSSDATPVFELTLDNPQVGDIERLYRGGVLIASRTLTSEDIAPLSVQWGLSAWANGSYSAYATTVRGGESSPSNTEAVTINDTTAPTLSAATGTVTGTTTADLSVTTNEDNGTLYAFASTSATPPSAATLKAGTGAAYASSQAVTSAGAKTFSATGLGTGTAHYAHSLHRDFNGNESAIATSASFTPADIHPNILTYPDDLTQSYWNKQDSAASLLSGAGSDGGDASRITLADGPAAWGLYRFYRTPVGGASGNYNVGFDFKPGSGVPYLHVRVAGGLGNKGSCINTATGALSTGYDGGANALPAPDSASVTPLSGGWSRFEMTANGDTLDLFLISFSQSATTTASDFTGVETIDFCNLTVKTY